MSSTLLPSAHNVQNGSSSFAGPGPSSLADQQRCLSARLGRGRSPQQASLLPLHHQRCLRLRQPLHSNLQGSMREAVTATATDTVQVLPYTLAEIDDSTSLGASAPQHAPRGSIRRGASSRRHLQVADDAAEVLVPPPPLLYPKRGDVAHSSASRRSVSTGQVPNGSANGASAQHHAAAGYLGLGGGPIDFATGFGVGSNNAEARGSPQHAEEPRALYEQITACSTCHSLERLLRMQWADLMGAHLRAALWRLSYLVTAEDPPSDARSRTEAYDLAGSLAERLRVAVLGFPPAELAVTATSLARMQHFDGELLRAIEAAATASQPYMQLHHAAGLLWAFGRLHGAFQYDMSQPCAAALLGCVGRHMQPVPAAHATTTDVWTGAVALASCGTGASAATSPAPPAGASAASSKQLGVACAMALHGMAQLRHMPDVQAHASSSASPLMQALLQRLGQALPACMGPELAMAMWAVVTLRVHPGPGWLEAYMRRLDAPGVSRTLSSGSMIANVLWGLATFGVQPPAAWMHNMLIQLQRRFGTCDAQSLSMTTWSLARMRFRPSPSWIQQLLRQARRKLCPAIGSPSPGSNNNTNAMPLAAVGAAGTARRGAAAAAMPAPPQAYNNLLRGMVRLGIRPSGQWMVALCRSLQPHLAVLPPEELMDLAWAVSELSFIPGDEWTFDFCCAARGALRRCGPPQLVLLLTSLGRMSRRHRGFGADAELVSAAAAALQPSLDRLQPTTLITLLGTSVWIRPPLPAAWYTAVVHAIRSRAATPGFTPRCIVNAVHAAGLAARLAAPLPVRYQSLHKECTQLLDELMPRAHGLMVSGQLNRLDLLLLAQGLAGARYHCSPEWLRRHEALSRQWFGHQRAGTAAGGSSGDPAGHNASSSGPAPVLAAQGPTGITDEQRQLVLLHMAYRVLGHRPELLPRPSSKAWQAVVQAARGQQVRTRHAPIRQQLHPVDKQWQKGRRKHHLRQAGQQQAPGSATALLPQQQQRSSTGHEQVLPRPPTGNRGKTQEAAPAGAGASGSHSNVFVVRAGPLPLLPVAGSGIRAFAAGSCLQQLQQAQR